MSVFTLQKNKGRGDHKYVVTLYTEGYGGAPHMLDRVKFGHRDYSDYTQHRDKDRRDRYLARHEKREDWGPTGVLTPGWWARWLLWNEPSISAAVRSIESRFGLTRIWTAG